MNVDLLSKMIKELILVHDQVCLPGIGSFVAEIMPSVFSDRGYTVNPPYRKLSFRTNAEPDDLLVVLYARSNNLDLKTAGRVVCDFTAELKQVLFEKKTVILPGMGRLRATKENNIFFVPDEELDIYPAGFGLQAISLKTHQETKEEVSKAVEDLKAIINDIPIEVPASQDDEIPVEEPQEEESAVEGHVVLETEDGTAPEEEPAMAESVEEPEELEEPEESEVPEEPEEHREEQEPAEPVEEEADAVASEEKEEVQKDLTVKKERKAWKKVLAVSGIIVAVLAVALLVFVVLADLCPDFIDRILYTEEELEILNGVF